MFYFWQMRYALHLSYLGTDYAGWQKQPNAITVQEVLEQALATVIREELVVLASGRTDAGVHAGTQIVHLDTPREISKKEFSKINRVLPHDVSINRIAKVEPDFHARFLATERSYIYTIDRRKNPFAVNRAYFFSYPLELDKLNEASKILLGKHDFKSFAKVKTEVNNFKCEITKAEWKLHGTQLCFYVTANRFLRGMVRALVGTLLEVGQGRQEPNWVKQVIEAQDRTKAGRNVPPEGLSLTEVAYPQKFNWVEII